MKGIFAAPAVLSALLVVCFPGIGSADDTDTTLRLYWKDGLRMETSDKQFKFKIGGRIMNDWAFFDVDNEIKVATGDDHDDYQRHRVRVLAAGWSA